MNTRLIILIYLCFAFSLVSRAQDYLGSWQTSESVNPSTGLIEQLTLKLSDNGDFTLMKLYVTGANTGLCYLTKGQYAVNERTLLFNYNGGGGIMLKIGDELYPCWDNHYQHVFLANGIKVNDLLVAGRAYHKTLPELTEITLSDKSHLETTEWKMVPIDKQVAKTETDNKTEVEAEKNTTENIAADGEVSQKVDEEHFVEEQNVKEDNNASEILSERIEPDLLVAEEKKVSDVSPTVKRKEQESVKEKRTRESTSGLVQSVGVSTAGFSKIYFYDDLENNMVIDVADDRTLFFLDYSIGYQFSSGLRFSLLFEGTILKEFQYDGPYHIEPVTPGVQLAACAEARYSAVVGKLCPFLAIGIGHSLMGLETNGIDPYYVKIGQAFRLRGKQCVELSIGYKTIYATESFSFSVAYSF